MLNDNTTTLTNNGFTLQRLEVYNWGTFNNRIYVVEPNNETSILTGKNGSGKSTLVDAFLTLLVPGGKRAYNQASGEKRNERQEKSYVRGAFNRTSEGGLEGQVKYLREPNKSYTVILAVFCCSVGKTRTVTIAQLMIQGDHELTKHYIVSQEMLSIERDFHLGNKDIRSFLKNLRAQGHQVFSAFKEYNAAFRRLVNLQSEQSMELFNRTVSMKEIGSLNEFVRKYMLEGIDSEQTIEDLKTNFEALTAAHNAILKADAQQNFLKPLMSDYERFKKFEQQIATTQTLMTNLVHYVEYRRLHLLEQQRSIFELERDTYGSELNRIEQTRHEADERRIYLTVQLQKDEEGQIIALYEKDEQEAQTKLRKRQLNAELYNSLATALGLAQLSDMATFHAVRQQAESAIHSNHETQKDTQNQRDQALIEADRLQPAMNVLEKDLILLRKNPGSIPSESQNIRQKMAERLQIPAEEFPFVGELISVKETEQEWEGAIERLMRPYALTLLVNTKYIRQVSQYVDRNHLKGKLVYKPINLDERSTSKKASDSSVYYKLRLKHQSPFYEWLNGDILQKYNNVACVTSETEFLHEPRALTKNGQIKSPDRFEKDDRFVIDDRTRYVLGWDNQLKIKAIERELHKLSNQYQEMMGKRQQTDKHIEFLNEQNRHLDQLLRYDDFTALDWQSSEASLLHIQQELRNLRSSADHLVELQRQLEQAEATYKKIDLTRTQMQTLFYQYERSLHDNLRQSNKAQEHLAKNPEHFWQPSVPLLEAEFDRFDVTLDTLDEVKETLRDRLTGRSSTYTREQNTIGLSLSGQINVFRMTYPTDTESIGSGLAALSELGVLLERIEREDLPRYKKSFKEMLDKKVIDNISFFKSKLEQEIGKYQEVIHTLNLSLRDLSYEPSSYIQLQGIPTHDSDIRQFRHDLEQCLDNTLTGSQEANELAFQNIQKLIQRLEKDEKWKIKVIDVRNWLNFSAKEFWKSDQSEKSYYNDSAAMSGGQKAKLAYTILGSAIAHQYGLSLQEKGKPTFRFAVIDEAFSKVDEVNAQYAMELFKALGLQLLVVTPMDKVNIVEPYVHSYHLVTNSLTGNDSRVVTLSVEAFEELKPRLLAEMEAN